MSIKFDANGLNEGLVSDIAEAGIWLMQHTDMSPADINHELALRVELARIIGTSLSDQTMQ